MNSLNTPMRHQRYIEAIARLALARLPESEREAVECQITYGAGQRGLRGITYYDAWQAGEEQRIPLVEVCAFGESDPVQLAGTTIHELGHVLAGFGAAHGKNWKQACERLGLRCCKAAGTRYSMAMFSPELRHAIADLPSPTDGKPVSAQASPLGPINGLQPRPCPAGIGTKGGTSRGKGSGSRLRLYECQCPKPVKVRVSSDTFAAHCDHCKEPFTLIK